MQIGKKPSVDRLYQLLITAFFCIVVILCFIRLFFSAELTDEAFHIAEPYLVSRGAVPIVNLWSQLPGFALLLAPFCSLYTAIAGGTEGIFLYMRIVSFLISLLAMFSAAQLLKRMGFARRAIVLYVAPYCIAFWFSIAAFRGDKLAILLVWLCGLLLALSFARKKASRICAALGGICAALSALCHGMLLPVCALLAITLLIMELRAKEPLRRTVSFVIGGLATAVVIVGYLVIRGGGVANLIAGIRYLLADVVYFRVENEGIAKMQPFLQLVWAQVVFYLKALGVFLAAALIMDYLFRTLFRDRCQVKATFRQITLCAILLSAVFCVLRYVLLYRDKDDTSIIHYTFLLTFLLTPALLPFIKNNRAACNRLFAFIWVPSLLWMVATSIGTYDSPTHRITLLSNGAILAILFAYCAVCDSFALNRGALYACARYVLPLAFAATIVFSLGYNTYSYVYRDSYLKSLTCRVESGVYRGVYTTPERAAALIELESEIRNHTSGEDRVLVMDSVPFGYLLTDAMPCTPSSWDFSGYAYGFNEDRYFLDYFAVTGKTPTKILYVDYGRDERMSIETEDYKFNRFVNDHYDRIYENHDMPYRLIVFTSKPDFCPS